MKKSVKIILISSGSLLALLILVVLTAMYLIFTPARLTSIVNRLSEDYVNCESDFGKVELTLFKTFPFAGIEVHDVALVNPTDFAPNDTLASVATCTLAINVRDFLEDGSIVVKELIVDGVSAHLAVAQDGRTNYDILPTSEEVEEPSEADTASLRVDLSKVKISNVACSYDDYQSNMHAAFDGLDVNAKGGLGNDDLDATLSILAKKASVHMLDSSDTEDFGTLLADVGIDLSAKGCIDKLVNGNVKISVAEGDLRYEGEEYVNEKLKSRGRLLSFEAPFVYTPEEVEIGQSELSVGQFAMLIGGVVKMPQNSGLVAQIDFEAKDWNVKDLVASLPYEYGSWSEGMILAANAAAKGSIDYGTDSLYQSVVKADISLVDARWGYPEYLPYTFDFPYADMDLCLYLTDKPSTLGIRRFEARMGGNRLKGKVNIDDLTNRFLVDARVSGHLRLHDALNLVYYPEPLPMKLEGTALLQDIRLKTDLAQLEEVALSQMRVSGRVDIDQLDVDYDSILLDAQHVGMTVSIPSQVHSENFDEMMSVSDLKGSLHVSMPSMGVDAVLDQADISLALSDIMNPDIPFSLCSKFSAEHMDATYDQMPMTISSPRGEFEYVPNTIDPAKEHYRIILNTRTVNAQINDTMTIDLGTLTVAGTADYDSTRSNTLKQWNPNFDIRLGRGIVQSSGLLYSVQLPDMKVNYTPERCEITDSKIIYGRSEIDFTGTVEGLEDWISSEGMLKADLDLVSNYTNVDELMELFSGAGTDADTLSQMLEEDGVKPEACPFIVPKDVLLNLNINIQEALAFENELEELNGNVKIYDGTAVLQAVSFVCDAGKMQVDAMYQSPRPNKLYAGVDFHLVDLKIDELIKMIPMVDTIVPMLAYCEGDADFHMIFSTYLYPDYTPMIPKMRGAVAIKGRDIKIIDNNTFDKIATLMKFKRKTENKFDSLDVELTLYKDEVELFPSMISIDKYAVCVAGSHLLDPKRSDNDYHLEIIESPLPARLAVDVKGISPLSIKLGKVQYADLYRPERRNAAQQQSLEFKRLILATLESKVKESTKKMKKSE